MKVFSDAGLAFLKATGSALLVVAIGISASPNLDSAVAVGIAGVIAAFAAGLAALQVFVPQISFRMWIGEPWGAIFDSFTHAAVGGFLTSLIGIMAMPDLSAWKSLIVAALIGAVNAGFRAIQGRLTPGEKPATTKGLRAPQPSTKPVLAPA